MTNSIRKGKAFERLVAQRLREVWPEAKRGLSQTRDGAECADVEVPGYWIECKKWKVFTQANKVSAYVQAAEASKASNKIPIVVWQRQNSRDVMCSMRLHDAIRINGDIGVQFGKYANPLIDFEFSVFISALKRGVKATWGVSISEAPFDSPYIAAVKQEVGHDKR